MESRSNRKAKDYRSKKESLSQTNAELARLNQEMMGIKSSLGSKIEIDKSYDFDERLINIIARREELKFAQENTIRWLEIIDNALSALNEEERLILHRFYIDRGKNSIDLLCEELYLERSRVYKLKDRAIRHFTLVLYGVLES